MQVTGYGNWLVLNGAHPPVSFSICTEQNCDYGQEFGESENHSITTWASGQCKAWRSTSCAHWMVQRQGTPYPLRFIWVRIVEVPCYMAVINLLEKGIWVVHRQLVFYLAFFHYLQAHRTNAIDASRINRNALSSVVGQASKYDAIPLSLQLISVSQQLKGWEVKAQSCHWWQH